MKADNMPILTPVKAFINDYYISSDREFLERLWDYEEIQEVTVLASEGLLRWLREFKTYEFDYEKYFALSKTDVDSATEFFDRYGKAIEIASLDLHGGSEIIEEDEV